MSKVHVFDHPLIQHKLSYIRDARTGTKEFFFQAEDGIRDNVG